MAYAAKQDLIDRYSEDELIQLTDRGSPPSGGIDDQVLARALDDATAEIDLYIGARAGNLVGTAHPALKEACEVLARERLFRDRATDVVKADAERVRKELRDVASGLATLSGGAVVSVASPVTFKPGAPVFSRDKMEYF